MSLQAQILQQKSVGQLNFHKKCTSPLQTHSQCQQWTLKTTTSKGYRLRAYDLNWELRESSISLHQVIRLSLGSQPAAILLVEQHATTVVSHENGVGNHPEEVIGIVRTQAHQFENVVHSLGGNLGVEPKLNISILCLHESKNNAPPLNTLQKANKQTNHLYTNSTLPPIFVLCRATNKCKLTKTLQQNVVYLQV